MNVLQNDENLFSHLSKQQLNIIGDSKIYRFHKNRKSNPDSNNQFELKKCPVFLVVDSRSTQRIPTSQLASPKLLDKLVVM